MHIRQDIILPATTGVGGLLVGVAGGLGISYLRTKKLREEIKELNNGYAELQRKVVLLGKNLKERADAIERFTEQLTIQAAAEREKTQDVPFASVPEEIAEVVSIFPTQDTPAWDQEEENKKRERFQGRPYIISVEEFQENELGLNQHTITWYEGDKILADEQDTPIYNHANVVGELKFGYGSGDPNIVYIRNVRGKQEYEVIRDSGYFKDVVEGIHPDDVEEAELKHSSVRRFRGDD